MKKFLKKAGNTYLDALKGTADFTLSAFGAKDVIGDDAYKTKFGKNVINNVANTAGGISGQIAANVLAPGVGGAAMASLQQGVGAATDDPVEDPMKTQMERNAKAQNFLSQIQPQQTFTPTFKYGGSMKKLKDGGAINRWVIDNTKIEGDNYTLPGGKTIPKAEFEKYMNIPINAEGKILPPHKGGMPTDYHPFRGIELPPEGRFLELPAINPVTKNNPEFTVEYKYGGKLNSYSLGGKFQEYNGQTHQGPNEGIEVDPSGNPTATTGQAPVALVENDETRWQDYIFSDSIKVPKSKETFADKSKKIKKKYELRLGKKLDKFDPVDSSALEAEMTALMGAQEAVKAPKQTNKMKNGGKLPKYNRGGTYGNIVNAVSYLNNDPNARLNYFTLNNNPANLSPIPSNSGASIPLQNSPSLASSYGITPQRQARAFAAANKEIGNMGQHRLNSLRESNASPYAPVRSLYDIDPLVVRDTALQRARQNSNIAPINSNTATVPTTQGQLQEMTPRSVNPTTPKSIPNDEELYQGGINPLALAAPVVGNIVGMVGESRRRNVPLNLGRVAPQQINLESARSAIRGQATSARAANRAAMQQSGATASNLMTGNLAGSLSTQRAAGEGLANTYLQEQQFNAQARAQADATNLQAQSQEAMFGARQKLMSQDRMRQYRDSISSNVAQYFSEDQRSRQQAQLMGLMSDNYLYTQSGPWYNRKIHKRLADTNVTQRG